MGKGLAQVPGTICLFSQGEMLQRAIYVHRLYAEGAEGILNRISPNTITVRVANIYCTLTINQAWSQLILKSPQWGSCSLHFQIGKEWGLERSCKRHIGTSLVAQWLKICLSMQGTWISSLGQQDPTCLRGTKPESRNYWRPRTRALPQEKPPWWEACTSQLECSPYLLATRESPRAVRSWHSQKWKKKKRHPANQQLDWVQTAKLKLRRLCGTPGYRSLSMSFLSCW